MKTPITYYGGKQSLLKHILPLIPMHRIYIEPFAGGAAVFWAKEQVPVEVLNDTNREVINFYEILQKRFPALKKEIEATLHSRELHRQAGVVYENPEMFSPLKRAWALWALSCMSFTSSLSAGWRHEKGKRCAHDTTVRKERVTKEIRERLQNVQLECIDALRVIQLWDDADAFFYIDPPYFNANMGHYGGYTSKDFEDLLKVLSTIKGKFLLSSYPSVVLKEYTKRNNWKTINIVKNLGIRKEGQREKIEVLTANYDVQAGEHLIRNADGGLVK